MQTENQAGGATLAPISFWRFVLIAVPAIIVMGLIVGGMTWAINAANVPLN